MKRDNEKIKELVKLSEENPELEIMFMTNHEVLGDDWGYWLGHISKVSKDDVWTNPNNDRMYWDSDSIEDEIFYSIEDNSVDYPEDMSNEAIDTEVKRLYKEYKESGEIKEAIVVFIDNWWWEVEYYERI